VHALTNIDTRILAVTLPIALVVLVHLFSYLADPYQIRSYPGPFLAKFSDAWLGCIAALGQRSEIVHQMHLKYGK
jgi:benzoate 4-monooxygenase